MLERGLQLFVVCFLGIALGRPQLDVFVTDARQAAMLKESMEHHIVVPYCVDNDGNFLSHNLLHHRTRRAAETKQIHYHIPFKNNNFRLSLTRNDDFMAPGLTIEWWSGKTTQPERNCHYIGSLKNRTGSSVAMSNCKGLAGLIRAGDDVEYFIEPVLGVDVDDHGGKHHHVIYRRSAAKRLGKKNDTEPACGVTVEDAQDRRDIREKPSNKGKGFYLRRRPRSVSLMKHVEVLLVADHTMTEFHGNRNLDTYLLTILNMLALVFKHRSIGSAINVVTVRMIILDKEYDNGLNITNHAKNSLGSFCKWVKKINPDSDQNPLHADAAVLVTRRDICRESYKPCETLGLSNIDGMCSVGSECSYNEDTGFSLVYTIAHELGHNLGALHDEDYSSCATFSRHIMASSLVINPSQHVWSKCSRKAVKAFFYKGWGWCLNDRPGANIQPKKQRVLPGETFNADDQCKLMFGSNSTICVATKSTLCYNLWCIHRNGLCATKITGTRSGFPALDGTPCGKNKWCIRGKCQGKAALKQPIDGNWGEWNRWGACSKSCGRGIRRKTRKCNSPKPEHGGFYCVGEWKRHSICKEQSCPSGSASSIEIQCKKFMTLVIHGKRYNWSAKQNHRNPCELRCIPIIKKGQSRIRKFIQAEDGTPCNHGTLNICIQGKCEHVGCDNKLYSSAREDRCGICRGDASTCETKHQLFDKPKGEGYTEALVIPAGARNIVIDEVTGSPNFLAFRSSKGDYFLNGNWYIQWGGNYQVAGTNGHYSRRHNRETFKAKGPIKEDLHVVLLYQAKNPGLKVQYDVKRNISSVALTFHWRYSNWTACSVTCGRGIQKRVAECVNGYRNVVDNMHCSPNTAVIQRFCNPKICPPSWWVGFWHECSKTCGDATRFRPVLCTQVAGDKRHIIGEFKCEGDRPPKSTSCQQPLCWVVYPWSNCSSSCGPGIQRRQVQCPGNATNCDIATKPATNRTCVGDTCLQWIVGEWGECSVTCGNGTKSRSVKCEVKEDESKCNGNVKPTARRACPGFLCPLWKTGNWSECSVTCEKGIQRRNITCEYGHSGVVCQESEKPEVVRSCLEKKCSGWVVEDWGHCSTSCGEGVRERKVICANKSCSAATRPRRKEPCKVRDCPKWLPGDWGECSASCGVGRRSRNVTCSEGSALCQPSTKPTTVELCVITECLVWSVGNWSECSVSCGLGVQTRTIVCNAASQSECDKNNPTTERKCHMEPCVQWKTAPWGQCSSSCGTGFQNRRVWCPGLSCDLQNKPNSTQSCYNEDCAVWVTGNWRECSENCGEGVQTRQVYCSDDDESECESAEMPESTRDCFVSRCNGWNVTRWGPCSARCGLGLAKRKAVCSLPKGNCTHKPRVLKICHQPPCSKWSTGQWSPCSVTCGLGFQRRIVSCQGGRCLISKKPVSTKECHKPSCPEWIAGNWSECSESCGGGQEIRKVSCGIGLASTCPEHSKPSVRQPCNTQPCPYWSVGSWGNCSSSCGQGTQTRNVTCVTNTTALCDNSTKPSMDKDCFSGLCRKWASGNWTTCSRTCGTGTQTRNVFCQGEKGANCSGQTQPVAVQSCSEAPCPQWSVSEWNNCSKTCGGGNQSRTVTCNNSHVGKCLDKDRPDRTRKCGESPCPIWSVGLWSKCSKTCGGGNQSRTVACNNSHVGKCLDKDRPDRTRKCGESPCPIWSVGLWSKCSKTCGGGNHSRTVACNNSHVGKCLDKDRPDRTRKCGESPCPIWSVGLWSKCSKTCGGGNQSRTVACNNSHVGKCLDKDRPDRTRKCGESPCPIWSVGLWSKCSKTCGGGNQSRTVTCNNSHVGKCLDKDRPDRTRKCGESPCPIWSVGLWSKCSKTCGGGNQSRTVTCNNSHVGKCLDKDRPDRTRKCGESPCPIWSVGLWSKCSKTCGGGNQSRTFTCKNSHVGKCSEKDKPEKVKKCGESPCPGWAVGEWNKCSKTCGDGTQSRTVTCKNSHVGKCLEKDKPAEVKKCGESPCPRWSVGEWTKCSKTCGGGRQSRTVICKNSHVGKCSAKAKPGRFTICGEPPCPHWSVSEWTKCSNTCGGGTQSRTVTCKNNHVGKCSEKDKPEKRKTCGESPCPEWSVSDWTKCSKSCGGGRQSRTVICKNSHVGICSAKDKPGRFKICGESPCPQWSVSEWTKCSKTCGGGTQSRTVTCKNSHVGKCSEKNKPEKARKCGESPCPQWAVGEWNKCSKTCGGGTQSRNVTCKNSRVGKCLEKDKPGEVKKCGESPCPILSVGEWNKCSKTCGGGTQSRTVVCKNGHVDECSQNDKPGKIRKCGESPCPKWSVSEWTKCSKTCGDGRQSRTVICKNSHVGKCSAKAKPGRFKICGEAPCPLWSVGEWTKCSKTCGGGIQSRTVICKNGHVGECSEKDKPGKTKKCGEAPCPIWSVGEWTKCSKTCGGGSQSRTVICKNNHVGKCSEKDKPENEKRCSEVSCPIWSTGEWTKCSKSCGGGTQSRTVACKNSHIGKCSEKDKPDRSKECGKVPCPQWSVGEWNKCSKTCGGGMQSRSVICKSSHVGECSEKDKPGTTKNCSEASCPEWSAGQWTKCSKSCGGGTKSRTVACKNSHVGKCLEKDKPDRSKFCGESPCPQWSVGEWTKCSKTCGGGTKSRTVACKNSHVGKCPEKDKPDMNKQCSEASCPEWSVGEWNKCSKTCGGGTQSRTVTCKNNHVGKCSAKEKPNANSECGEAPCPQWSVGKWTKCSKTCGGGTQSRTVTCTNSHVGKCSKKDKPGKTKICGEASCPIWSVGEWSKCSKTCGSGEQSRTVTCKNNHVGNCSEKDKPETGKKCGEVSCPEWSVGQWSKCSKSCGGGRQSRTVTCKNSHVGKCSEQGKPGRFKICGEAPCPAWSVGEWTKCSKTCGGGTQSRTVICKNSHVGKCSEKDKPDRSKECGKVPCPQWSVGEWTKCSKTCGGGMQSRSVICKNSHVGECSKKDKPGTIKNCSEALCPEWSTGQWTKCSKTCGGGTKSRTVACKNSHVGKCLEKDKPDRGKLCGESPCPQWSVGEWTKCSKTCGGGTKSRTVACKNSHVGKCPEKDKPDMNKQCSEASCPEWSTGQWTKCSKTCGGGTHSRTVTCKNGHVGKCSEKSKPGKIKKCSEAPCPQWTAGQWSKCSKTCGGGTQARTVVCKNSHVGKCSEKDKPGKTKKCGEAPCPEWSTGQWSTCSKTCGGGTQSRTVTCTNSHVGKCSEKDKPGKTKKCGKAPCPIWSVGEWSKCSKTCGSGTQSRTVMCENNHVGKCSEKDKPEKGKKCGEAPCPIWSTGEWTKCSKTCGGGRQSRTVTCKNSHVGKCSEQGKPGRFKICGEAPCPAWSFGEWTKCSKTCGGGTQSRTVICKNSYVGKCPEKDKPSTFKLCGDLPCPMWAVGEWNTCSKTCGGGTQTRTVHCKNNYVGECLAGDQPDANRKCGEASCPEWSTGHWTKCSKTCGGGTQTRTVSCKNSHVGECSGKIKPDGSKKCGESPCPRWSVGEWTKCSKTCGGGRQSRTVICNNSHVGKCSAKAKPGSFTICGESPCPHWSVSEWTKCSKTCGGGTQSRRVTCKNNHVGKCSEKDKPEKRKTCGAAACPEWSVGQWSKCSKTCGGGTQSRSVTCKNSHVGKCCEKDKPGKTKKCGEASCPIWSVGEWSKCSKTCGGGTQTRTVTCTNSHVGKCSEKDKPCTIKKCDEAPCPVWSVGEWSKCSKTCGSGEQSRTVVCKNNHVGKCSEKDKPEKGKKCGEAPCPIWSTGQWTKCSKTCGGGSQSRTVTCTNSHVGKCSEKDKPGKTKICGEAPCPIWSVGLWSKCSKTCGGGTQSRTVTCKNNHVGNCSAKDKPDANRECGEAPCPQWSVDQWSKCSKTCGGGTQSRTVTCTNSHVGKCLDKDRPDRSRKCGELPCPRWSVGLWSKCSKTCGGGTQSRTVTCTNSHVGKCFEKDKPGKTKICGEAPCPIWSVGEWSKCSKTCGGGTQSRIVTCKNNHVGKCSEKNKPGKGKKCGELPCPEWSIGPWSKCSKTCGGGTQSRTVTCKNNHVGKCSAKDKPDANRECGEAPCPQWSVDQWSECSKTCGGGTQSRTVTCTNSHVGKCSEKDKPGKTKICGEAPCPIWSFGEWSKCSKTCGGGTQSRTVTCENNHFGKCSEKNKPEKGQKCGEAACPEWSVGPWSKCSKTCGGGTQSRTVTCKNNHVGECSAKDKPDANRECGEAPCPQWSVDQWSKCSKSCGGGTQSRTVTCTNNHVGKCSEKDKPDTNMQCNEASCPEWSTGHWSKCSKTCGGGTQSRTVTCKNNHVDKCSAKDKPDANRECGEAPCPQWSVDQWSKCSKSCGGGTQSRTVTCTNSHVGKCSEKDKPGKTKICGEAPCPIWSVGLWSKCSKTCGGGTQSRTVTCKNNHVGKCSAKDKPDANRECGEAPCPQWSVGKWTKCSKTCGGGTQSRTVTCTNSHVGKCSEKDKPGKTKICGEAPCPIWSVGLWSKCSKTCGGGTQSRTVTCKNNHVGKCSEKDKPDRSKKCGKMACPQWSVEQWSKCSKTCGGGTQSRTVICKNSHVGKCSEKDKPEKGKKCGESPCPKWSVGLWSKCSKTCGGGTQSRTVTCKNNHVGKCSAKDKPDANRECGEAPCPQWSVGQWSKCSKTCGGGTQARSIFCSNNQVEECLDKRPITRKTCGDVPCPRWLIGKWKKCSKTCATGEKVRKVWCSGEGTSSCDGVKPVNSESCNEQACPYWIVTPWSKCLSRRCGHGKQNRTVACSGKKCTRKEKPAWRRRCKVECPQWKTSEWTECQGSCSNDQGQMTRRVWCDGGNRKCKRNKKPKHTKRCLAAHCLVWWVGRWNKCPVTCGGGMRGRSIRCINKETKKITQGCQRHFKPLGFQACALTECPHVQADSKPITRENCHQAAHDTYFCNLLLKPSLTELCLYRQWKNRCCKNCLIVHAQMKLLK